MSRDANDQSRAARQESEYTFIPSFYRLFRAELWNLGSSARLVIFPYWCHSKSRDVPLSCRVFPRLIKYHPNETACGSKETVDGCNARLVLHRIHSLTSSRQQKSKDFLCFPVSGFSRGLRHDRPEKNVCVFSLISFFFNFYFSRKSFRTNCMRHIIKRNVRRIETSFPNNSSYAVNFLVGIE